MNNQSVEQFIVNEYMKKQGLGKTEAVMKLCKDFSTTYPTVYRWIKDDSVRVIADHNGFKVYKILAVK